MFPEIEHINDVLHYIEDKDEFRVNEREGYIYIDYMIQKEDTFSDLVTMECRGLKFYPDGRIMARPLQKAFNRGERSDMERTFAKGSYEIFDKLDGSMIHTALSDSGDLLFMTRAGLTDVAAQAERYIRSRPDADELLAWMKSLSTSYTVILEYTAPDNRIVVRYDEPDITLLAVRHNVTGTYVIPRVMPRTLSRPRKYGMADILDLKDWKDREGVVLHYANGFMIKIKADDYVLKHRCKDSIRFEKNILQLILTDGVDDLVGVLDNDDYEAIKQYQRRVLCGVKNYSEFLAEYVAHSKGMSRKEIAKEFLPHLSPIDKKLFWPTLDGHDPHGLVKDYVLKNCSSQTKVDENVRPIIQVEWNG